ncbi:hypothetical protein CORC01_08093 [Colletotrichum orchidophilum]|uniref:Uncharacterized protein n=1 Tax=Colletotrichum orchidophilum TaxID=1209926 RepID=A0A1G4B5N1_9PEZI|nr:uncharacterized protein CORC01_08093 [Colletotrichum orchidophilum]OHE96636.1 hypothetical protein CORC01_08093 [Colletotrichum orchidophilum]
MDASSLPTSVERNENLMEVVESLQYLNGVTADLSPWINERVKELQDRAQACFAPYDTDIHEELALYQDFLSLKNNVHEFTNYRHFLWRLQEADTRNLLGTYLSGRLWAQEWYPNMPVPHGCEYCWNWHTSRDQELECEFLFDPLEKIFQAYFLERAQTNEWVAKAMIGRTDEPQPRSPIDDYLVRVSNYSLYHNHPDDGWDIERIYDVLLETDRRASGLHMNCREFLHMGWDKTVERIDSDGDTALARVRGMLSNAQAKELMQAIHYDGRMYYVASFYLDYDGRYLDQQPRQWVIDALATNPPGPWGTGVPWKRILTVDRFWPVFEVDDRGNVLAWCQFIETGRRWKRRWVGTLDGDWELQSIVENNMRNEWAWSEADIIQHNELLRNRRMRMSGSAGTLVHEYQSDTGDAQNESLYEADDEAGYDGSDYSEPVKGEPGHSESGKSESGHSVPCNGKPGKGNPEEGEPGKDEPVHDHDEVIDPRGEEVFGDESHDVDEDISLGNLSHNLAVAELCHHFRDRERMSPRDSDDESIDVSVDFDAEPYHTSTTDSGSESGYEIVEDQPAPIEIDYEILDDRPGM